MEMFIYSNLKFYFLQAVQNGFWVVFEDIDKAPSDVQSIILPLLEGARSFSTGHGEVITCLFITSKISYRAILVTLRW